MYAHAIKGKTYSGYFQNMRKRMFFKLVRIRFEKQVSELQKRDKQTFEISIWVKKLQKYFFFKKFLLAPDEVKNILVTTKTCGKRFS